ncbi:MAG: thioredoxin domain-containing protein [Chitinophagaceae bacterium]|nr:thioredoxin domain-containing protein [Chitinophagaceae bacterium]
MVFDRLFRSLYENQVLTVHALLKQLKVNVTLGTIDETLHNHPDYPSFLSITDSLQKWNIESLAIQTDADKLDEIPLPFITSLKTGVFVTVIERTNQALTLMNQHGKTEVIGNESFLKQWSETIVVAEANEKSGEADYKKKLNQSLLKSIAYSLLPITFLAAILLPFVNGAVSLTATAYLLLKLIGFTVSICLLWYDIDKGNPLLKQICSGIQKANCNAVLNTKAASLFGVLSWSEVGFAYFSSALLFAIIVGINTAYPILSFVSLLACPYIVFSIYYQWKIAKQWCVLCLMVQGVLLLETVLVIGNGLMSFDTILTTIENNWLPAMASIALPLIVWFLLKPLLKGVQKAKYEKRSYLQLKYNDQVFWSLIQKQKSIREYSTEGLGITIGNPNAKHTIVKVCNPYCKPCANVHPELERLIEQNPNVKAKIVFSVSPNDEDYRVKTVSHLLAIAEKSDENVKHEALDDWYLAHKKDYDVFAAKYPMNGELSKQTEKIKKMRDWCDEVSIQYTPTIFVNGYELPKNYQLRDINYFLHAEV